MSEPTQAALLASALDVKLTEVLRRYRASSLSDGEVAALLTVAVIEHERERADACDRCGGDGIERGGIPLPGMERPCAKCLGHGTFRKRWWHRRNAARSRSSR